MLLNQKENKMKKIKNILGDLGLTATVLLCISVIPLVIYILGSWTDSNLEFWLSYYKGIPVSVPLWLSMLLSLVLNGVIVLLNLISEIVRLVI